MQNITCKTQKSPESGTQQFSEEMSEGAEASNNFKDDEGMYAFR